MTPRQIVAQKLVQGLTASGVPETEYVVRAFGDGLDNLDRPMLMVIMASIAPGAVPGSWLDCSMRVILAVPWTEPGRADEELDAWLLDVLAALETDDTHGIRWSSAARSVLDESWPSYDIELLVTLTKES